jgi:hypothetical protein
MAQFGLESVPNYPTDFAALPNWLDPFPSPFHKNVELVGYGGIGIAWDHLLDLWLIFPFCIIFFALRNLGKFTVFPMLARALGIKPSRVKRTRKFTYQCWLFLFYALSSVFGYVVQMDKPWLGFPMRKENMMGLFANFPHQPEFLMTVYFSYELAFYFTELFAILTEDRRADFVEYVIHHTTASILVLMSYAGYDHPMGSYILLIHDISDIFLCLAKIFHYSRHETIVTCNFVLFLIFFVWMRLICLPSNFIPTFYIAPIVRKACINYWILTFLLYGVLQVLHFYWFSLILKTIFRLFRGVKGDVRSDSDEGETEQHNPKSDVIRSPERSKSKKAQ